MDASLLFDRLQAMGIRMRVNEGKLQLHPGSAVPVDLVSEIKAKKEELLALLEARYCDTQAPCQELEEIKSKVEEAGYILLWSNVLQDLVAFYRDEKSRGLVPPGFVPYSVHELTMMNRFSTLDHDLRRIHETRMLDARIIGVDPPEINRNQGSIDEE